MSNEQLNQLLKTIEQKGDHVFPSEKGKIIDVHNFLSRKWKPLFKTLSIRYRPVYDCRSTFISHCLEQGKRVDEVALWVGNSPEILLKHYAGLVNRSEVPNL